MEYKLDDTLLLNSYLDKRLFNNKDNKREFWDGTIELIIRPECNQKCDYCYITQHGDYLYPKEYRADNLTLLNNLKMLLNYFTERKFYCGSWELFAGDLFYDNFWFDIMDVFKQYYLQFTDIVKDNIARISLPCNCSFFHDKEKTEKISQYIEEMEKMGVRVNISWSHDGPNLIDIREKRKIDEDYYKTAFTFLKRHRYGAHPMISYEGIDKAKEQYEWWINTWKEIGKNEEFSEYSPMFLEVRNEGWTDENIKNYLDFLNYVIDKRFKACNESPRAFAYHLFCKNIKKTKKDIPDIYFPLTVPNDILWMRYHDPYDSHKNCTFGHAYSINLSKLTIVPCHRLTYEHFEAGKFVVSNIKDNNNYQNSYLNQKLKEKQQKIIGIEAAQGLTAYLNIESANPLYAPGCCSCEYRYICMKGCYGAQYEAYGDWAMPIPEVCKLLKSKYEFLLTKYEELGVFESIFKDDNFPMSKKEKEHFAELLARKKGYRSHAI